MKLYLVIFFLYGVSPLNAVWMAPFETDYSKKEIPYQLFPRTSVTSDNKKLAVWTLNNDGIQAAYAVKDTWSAITTIASGMNRYSFPAVVVDHNKTAIAVWVAFDANQHAHIQASRFQEDGTWSQLISYDLGTADIDNLIVDASGDNDGNIMAAWIAKRHPSTMQAISLAADAPQWSFPLHLATDPSHNITQSPAIGMCNGKAIIVWKVNSPHLKLSSASYSFKSEKWSFATNVIDLPQAVRDVQNWSVALDERDNAVIVAHLKNKIANKDVIVTTAYHPSLSRWSNLRTLSNQISDTAELPFVGMDNCGNALAFWIEKGEGKLYLAHASSFKNKWFPSTLAPLSTTKVNTLAPIQIDFQENNSLMMVAGASLLNSALHQGPLTFKKYPQANEKIH